MKYLACLVGAVLAVGSVFTSCKLDDPEPLSAEELYLRAFIKQYGLIDPDQDWNQARRSSVTVKVEHARTINVFVEVSGNYYRVASYFNVKGTVEIPIDVPECVDSLFVLADDDFRMTGLGGSVDFTTKSKGLMKAPSQAVWIQWSTTQRGDGDSRDYPGNAGSVRSTISLPTSGYIDVTTSAHLGADDNVTKAEIGTDKAHNNNYEVGRIHQGMNLHFQLSNPTLSSYEISFNTASNDDKQIYRNTNTGERGNIINVTIVDHNNTIWLDEDVIYDNCGTSYLLNGAAVDPKSTEHKLIVPILPPGDYQMIVTMTRGNGSSVGGQLGLFQINEIPVEDLAWLLVAEDLGATDDFDFNDVIIRVQPLTTNVANLKVEEEFWQVIQDDYTHLVLSAPSRDDPSGETYTHLTIQAMCAGGILDSYLHFVNQNGDWVLGPGMDEADLTSTTPPNYNTSEPTGSEWHNWFTKQGAIPMGSPNNRLMLNTGQNNGWQGATISITVEGEFSVTNYSDIQFKDYDQSSNDGKDYWDLDKILTAWSYGSDTDQYKIHGFYISVTHWNTTTIGDYGGRIIGAPKPGAAPQMFCIPDCNAKGLWHWPYERVPIISVYPGFNDWVRTNTNTDWYTPNPIEVGVTTHEGVASTAVYPR